MITSPLGTSAEATDPMCLSAAFPLKLSPQQKFFNTILFTDGDIISLPIDKVKTLIAPESVILDSLARRIYDLIKNIFRVYNDV